MRLWAAPGGRTGLLGPLDLGFRPVDGWVERWLQTLPVEDVHREVAQLEAGIAELQAEIDKRRELLAMRQRWLDGGASQAEGPESTTEDPQSATPDPESATPERPTRAEALLRLLAEDPGRTGKLRPLRHQPAPPRSPP